MLLTILLHAFLSFFPSLEREKEISYEGSIVLETEEVLTGTFYFDEKDGLLYRKKKEGLEIFPIYKVKALYFFDARENINRQYIKVASDKFRYPYQLYEVVLSGEVKVLRKRKAYAYPLKDRSSELDTMNDHAYNYHYFTLHKGAILELSDFSLEVFPDLLEQHPVEISNLVETLDWGIDEPSGVIQLIKRYNRLAKAEPHAFRF